MKRVPRKNVKTLPQTIFIVADIEGSSGCWGYDGSSFMTEAWCVACLHMTRDVNALAEAVLGAGVERVVVQDFHRTGYNLLAEHINKKVEVRSGFRPGPVPGMGYPGRAEAVMFLGMHAASGTKGFLPHTLTSRISRLEVNGKLLPEVALFSASLAPFGMHPIFFSGCPIACAQAVETISGMTCYPIDKSGGPASIDVASWRYGLARAAFQALGAVAPEPYAPKGPFEAVVTMRDGKESADKIARRWGFASEGASIILRSRDIRALYDDLIRLCYLTPLSEKVLPWTVFFHGMMGRFGLAWVRRQLVKKGLVNTV